MILALLDSLLENLGSLFFQLIESIESRLRPYFDRYHTMKMDNFIIRDWEIEDDGRSKILVHPCRGQG